MTLVEVIIATSLLGIVSLVFTTTLASVQNAVVAQDVRTELNDQSRMALADLDRQVRSGNLLYNPSSETGNIDPFGVAASGYMFRVYTQVKFAGHGRSPLLPLGDRRRRAAAVPLVARARSRRRDRLACRRGRRGQSVRRNSRVRAGSHRTNRDRDDQGQRGLRARSHRDPDVHGSH